MKDSLIKCRCNWLIPFLILLANYRSMAQSGVDSTYNNSHYRMRMEYFNQVTGVKKEIVFVGNSITEAGDWLDIIPEKNVFNRGISGDISFGVLARLNKVLVDKPDKLFLLIGVNDLKRGIPNNIIIKNYRRIVNQVTQESPKTELYLQSVLPINEELLIAPFKKVSMDDIMLLNKALRKIAWENKIISVDLWPVLSDSNHQLKAEFTPDGIHLKPIAYIDWVNYLRGKKYL